MRATTRPRVGLIWAQAHNRAIGRLGTMPWHVPEDLAHFRETTRGSPVIMGRRTWESLPERFRPLPGRENLVLSRTSRVGFPGARRVESFDDALLTESPQVWVIGGAELYSHALAAADELSVTQIDLAVPDADAFAPEIGAEWMLVERSPDRRSASGTAFRFERYLRRAAD